MLSASGIIKNYGDLPIGKGEVTLLGRKTEQAHIVYGVPGVARDDKRTLFPYTTLFRSRKSVV